jgi:hypothetical protein
MDDRPSGGRKAPVDRTRRTGRLVRRPPLTCTFTPYRAGLPTSCPLAARNDPRTAGGPGPLGRVPGPRARPGQRATDSPSSAPWTVEPRALSTASRVWSSLSGPRCDGVLYSPYSRDDVPRHLRRTHFWRGGSLTGWCDWSPGVRPHQGLEAPQEGCDCGVRACTDLPQHLAHDPRLLRGPDAVVGLVGLSGPVLGVGTPPRRWAGASRPVRPPGPRHARPVHDAARTVRPRRAARVVRRGLRGRRPDAASLSHRPRAAGGRVGRRGHACGRGPWTPAWTGCPSMTPRGSTCGPS